MRAKRNPDSDRSEENSPPEPEKMPLCSACLRDGGITLYGKRKRPQRAVIHPLHQWNTYDKRTGLKDGVWRKGPAEALCGHHAELEAWDHRPVEAEHAPPPVWTQPATEAQAATVADIVAKFTADAEPAPRPDPYQTRVELSREMHRDREPGEEG